MAFIKRIKPVGPNGRLGSSMVLAPDRRTKLAGSHFAELLKSGAFRGKAARPERWGYEPKPGFLYVTNRAISSRVNANYDGWPKEHLADGYQTFLRRPVYVEHQNWDTKRSRGVIIGAKLHQDQIVSKDSSRTYDDWWAELLHEIDARQFPRLAEAIMNGDLNATSMGCEVASTTCSVCANVAEVPSEFCEHIPYQKGRMVRDASGQIKLCYEVCNGPYTFFEDSYVFDPADESALVSDFYLATTNGRVTGVRKVARRRLDPTRSSLKRHRAAQEQPTEKCPMCGGTGSLAAGASCVGCGGEKNVTPTEAAWIRENKMGESKSSRRGGLISKRGSRLAYTVGDIQSGDPVRAWSGGTLVLIGGPASVEPYDEKSVKIKSQVPLGNGMVVPTDLEITKEPSGTWTIIASGRQAKAVFLNTVIRLAVEPGDQIETLYPLKVNTDSGGYQLPPGTYDVEDAYDEDRGRIVILSLPSGDVVYADGGDVARARGLHDASRLADQVGLRLPGEVDTLRQEQHCPYCKTELEDGVCPDCGHEATPDEFDDPDTEPRGEAADRLQGIVQEYGELPDGRIPSEEYLPAYEEDPDPGDDSGASASGSDLGGSDLDDPDGLGNLGQEPDVVKDESQSERPTEDNASGDVEENSAGTIEQKDKDRSQGADNYPGYGTSNEDMKDFPDTQKTDEDKTPGATDEAPATDAPADGAAPADKVPGADKTPSADADTAGADADQPADQPGAKRAPAPPTDQGDGPTPPQSGQSPDQSNPDHQQAVSQLQSALEALGIPIFVGVPSHVTIGDNTYQLVTQTSSGTTASTTYTLGNTTGSNIGTSGGASWTWAVGSKAAAQRFVIIDNVTGRPQEQAIYADYEKAKAAAGDLGQVRDVAELEQERGSDPGSIGKDWPVIPSSEGGMEKGSGPHSDSLMWDMGAGDDGFASGDLYSYSRRESPHVLTEVWVQRNGQRLYKQTDRKGRIIRLALDWALEVSRAGAMVTHSYKASENGTAFSIVPGPDGWVATITESGRDPVSRTVRQLSTAQKWCESWVNTRSAARRQADIWPILLATCKHCGENIHYLRTVGWEHVDTFDRNCRGEDGSTGTVAEPANDMRAASKSSREQLEPLTPEYNKAYNRGWKSTNLEGGDARGEPEAWYDGYLDNAAGREKGHTPRCRLNGGCEEHQWSSHQARTAHDDVRQDGWYAFNKDSGQVIEGPFPSEQQASVQLERYLEEADAQGIPTAVGGSLTGNRDDIQIDYFRAGETI